MSGAARRSTAARSTATHSAEDTELVAAPASRDVTRGSYFANTAAEEVKSPLDSPASVDGERATTDGDVLHQRITRRLVASKCHTTLFTVSKQTDPAQVSGASDTSTLGT